MTRALTNYYATVDDVLVEVDRFLRAAPARRGPPLCRYQHVVDVFCASETAHEVGCETPWRLTRHSSREHLRAVLEHSRYAVVRLSAQRRSRVFCTGRHVTPLRDYTRRQASGYFVYQCVDDDESDSE